MNVDQTIEYIDDNENYISMHTNVDTGPLTYGGWKDWIWLKKNKPYVMKGMYTKSSPTLERVNENLYSVSENLSSITLDGSDPDVDGIYAFIPKIYYRETYISNYVREVEFTNDPKALEEGFTNEVFIDKDGNETSGIFVPATFPIVDSSFRIFSGWSSTGPGNGSTSDRTYWQRYYNSLKEVSKGYGCFMSWRLMALMRDLTIMLFQSANVLELDNAMGYGTGWSRNSNPDININLNWVNPQEEMMSGQFYGNGTGKGGYDTDAVLKTFHTSIFSNFRKGHYIWDIWLDGPNNLIYTTKNLNQCWFDNPSDDELIVTSGAVSYYQGYKTRFNHVDGTSYSLTSYIETQTNKNHGWYVSTSGQNLNLLNFMIWGRLSGIGSSTFSYPQDIRSYKFSSQNNPNSNVTPMGMSSCIVMPIYIFPDEFLKGVLKDD